MTIKKTIAYGMLFCTLAATAACGGNTSGADTNELIEKIDLLQKKITELESPEAASEVTPYPETAPAPTPAPAPAEAAAEAPEVEVALNLENMVGSWTAKSFVIVDSPSTRRDLIEQGGKATLKVDSSGTISFLIRDEEGKEFAGDHKVTFPGDDEIYVSESPTKGWDCTVKLFGDSMYWSYEMGALFQIAWERSE